MAYKQVAPVIAAIYRRQYLVPFDKEALLNNIHPLTYYVWMEQNFPREWDDFEPETVRHIFAGAPEEKVDRLLDLHGPWSVLRNQNMDMPLHAFEKIVMAFNGRTGEYKWHQEFTVPELCNTLSIIQTVLPLDAGHTFSMWVYCFLSTQDFEVVKGQWEFIRESTPAAAWISDEELPPTGLYPLLNEACEIYMTQLEAPVVRFLDQVRFVTARGEV